jgi:hypothetical protein
MPFPAGSYPAQVVADGAVAYWRFGETSGTTANDSIGTNHGTISGGVTLGQAGALADGDKAMAFNGTGEILVANPAALDLAQMSVEAWAYITSNPGQLGIYEKTNNGAVNSGISLQLILPTGWRVRVCDNFFNPFTVDAGSAPLNVWTYLVATCTGTTLRLYMNAVEVGVPATLPQLRRGIANAYLGTLAGTWNFIGVLDDVAVYPTALTAPQIAAHYAARIYGALPTVPWAVVGGMAWKDDMDSYTEWLPITTSDTVDLARFTDGILVGGAGDVAAVMQNNRAVTLTGLPAGAWVPIKARRINATGTTATSLVALYQD